MSQKILHVEDRLSKLEITRLYLEGYGYEVVSESDLTPELTEKLLSGDHDFDVIILDGTIRSADDGRNLATQLHAMGQKVIFASGGRPHETVPNSPDPNSEKRLIQIVREILGE